MGVRREGMGECMKKVKSNAVNNIVISLNSDR